MIVLSNSTAQVIPAGGTVTFDMTPLHTGCNSEGYGGAEYHKQGTGLVRLRASTKCRPSVFEINFSGNVSNPAAGTQLNLAINLDGATLPETNMLETVLVAGLFENVSTATAVKVCSDNGGSVTVVNNGTDPVILAPGSSLYIKRIA